MSDPMRIWRFYDAPEEWQRMFDQGGDEDYLAEIPPDYEQDALIESRTFGCCDIIKNNHPTKPGWFIYIGTHA